MSQGEISNEMIEMLKARDVRWKLIDQAIQLETELQNSIAVKAILEALQDYAEKALAALVDADSTNVREITALQEKVKLVKIIGNTFEEIRRKGKWAEEQLKEESSSANHRGED